MSGLEIRGKEMLERLLLALLVFNFLFASSPLDLAAHASEDKAGKTFIPRTDWLNQDFSMIDQVKDLVSFPPKDLAKLVSAFGNSSEQPLGFGLKRINLGKAAGYTSISMQVLVHNGRVIGMRCIQSVSTSFDKLVPVLKQRWKREPVEMTNNSMTFLNQIDKSALDEVLSANLGKAPELRLTPSLKQALQTLMSPFDQLMVGETGGLGATTPGYAAVQAIVNEKQYDFLRVALRGPNPEGRAFAARALVAAKQLRPDDMKVIETLKKLDLKLSAGEGCTERESKTFAELLKD